VADRALLERLAEEEAITRSESPDFVSWLKHLWDALTSGLGVDTQLLERLVKPSEIFLWVMIVAIPLGVLWLFRRPLGELLGRLRAAPPPDEGAVPLPPPPPDPRLALEQALALGDPAAALAALWGLVAGRLSAKGLGHFEPEMTQREFVESVRRSDPGWAGLGALAALAREVDALLYSGEGPDMDGVRDLRGRAEELIA
jgi:hypothetical protein